MPVRVARCSELQVTSFRIRLQTWSFQRLRPDFSFASFASVMSQCINDALPVALIPAAGRGMRLRNDTKFSMEQ